MKEIKKSQVLDFLKHLQKHYQVYLPIKKEKDWVFGQFDPETEIIDLKPVITILPLKKFFLPSGEKIFSFNQEGINYRQEIKQPIALVGINSFDLQALILLDQIMSRPYYDPYYWQRRKNTLIIGVGPRRINLANRGYDLFLEEEKDSFLAITGSKKGTELTNLRFFQPSKNKPKKILSFRDPLFSQLEKIQTALETNKNKRGWQKVAQTCFGCGICAYVCPLCYCYEVEDNFHLGSTPTSCGSCHQHRWDACFLPDFFAVAGHNFRDSLPERIYNWYHHKFVRLPKEYGQIGCIDCGRCIKYCPSKINFKKVLKELIKK